MKSINVLNVYPFQQVIHGLLLVEMMALYVSMKRILLLLGQFFVRQWTRYCYIWSFNSLIGYYSLFLDFRWCCSITGCRISRWLCSGFWLSGWIVIQGILTLLCISLLKYSKLVMEEMQYSIWFYWVLTPSASWQPVPVELYVSLIYPCSNCCCCCSIVVIAFYFICCCWWITNILFT